MNLLVILGIALYLCCKVDEELDTADMKVPNPIPNRVTKLNDDFFDDPDAFMRIAHVLGF